MDVKYINPFINSVYKTMETMLGVSPQRLDPFVKDHNNAQGDISGIIGFASQEVVGSVALTFPTTTALRVYQLMMGEVISSLNEEIQDTVGELANIIAGGAKEELSGLGLSYHLSIPTVVVGKNHTITHKGSTPVVGIPFKLEKDLFLMEISMKVKK
jgi:chemotaxis protein CheX